VSAQAVAAPVKVHRPLSAEDAARANVYALLARLLTGGPDEALLGNLADAEPLGGEADPALAAAWQALVEASSGADADAVAEEYEELFIGVGKARISIYAGFHGGAPAVDHPRVRIQADLAALGLARTTSTEPEDHYAIVFETMRVLAGGGAGREPAGIAEQKRFFDRHVAPGAARFFAVVTADAKANYYRRVAALGAAFVALETGSFELD
jgi:TorA maturation chaperone TorD